MVDRINDAPLAGAESSISHPSEQNVVVLNRDQFRHLGGLVADGEMSFASAARDLSTDDVQTLESVVRELSYARLVRYVVLQIARDIHDSRKVLSENKND